MTSAQQRAVDLKDAYVQGIMHGAVAGAFEDRMVAPSPENPYGFPDEIRSSEGMPEGFSEWDDAKKGAYFTLPLVDI